MLRIACAAAAARLLVRLPLPRLAALLERVPPSAARHRLPARLLVEHVDAVFARGLPFIRRGCLQRGLTLFYFLRRSGHPVSLCFGFGAPRAAYAGHCWVEAGGAPIGERRDPARDFALFYRIPRAGGSARPRPGTP